jgi:predicted ATPase
MKIRLKPKPEPNLPLRTFRLRNFKAVRDSGGITFTPLTVFIGNNGSGKSSLIEGLETFQNIVQHGLDDAFLPWRGFEHVWNKAVKHDLKENQIGRQAVTNPMRFEIEARLDEIAFNGDIEIATDNEGNKVLISHEGINTEVAAPLSAVRTPAKEPQYRVRDLAWRDYVSRWQFLNLEPRAMLEPKPQQRSTQESRLARDGSNIAQYLQSIADKDPAVLEGIAETLKSVLPFATDLRTDVTTELQRLVYLRLYEQGLSKEHVLPGWLLSQGTLRIVALLSVFRHPQPPSVVFIEEMENGLDPRTIHLLVEEIRSFLQDGGQVVATTHSPYLLDMLDLSQIVVVERGATGAPEFTRPSKKKLKGWAGKFAPGKLYTMGNLTKG